MDEDGACLSIELKRCHRFLVVGADYGDFPNRTALISRRRRYHAYRDGKYLGPNDEQESDRLDILHHIHLLQLDGALHKAPLGKDFSGEVLELGAGTGIWVRTCSLVALDHVLSIPTVYRHGRCLPFCYCMRGRLVSHAIGVGTTQYLLRD